MDFQGKVRSLSEIRNKRCKECELYRSAEFVCLPGYGKVPSKIMFVGEAPGHREDDSGVPFVGRSGKILNVILEVLELSRSDVYITNIVHCRPPKNKSPSMMEIRACRGYLLKEIKLVNPEVIVTLGAMALKGLFSDNSFSVGGSRGKILDFEGRKVIPTYHPRMAISQKYYGNIIYKDIKKGFRNKDKIEILKVETKGKYILVNKENKSKIFKELVDTPIITVDVESTSLDYMDLKERLICVGISPEPGKSYVWKANQVNLSSYIPRILNNKELVVNHNIKFDLEWLNRYDIRVRAPIFDTMVAKHILDENYPDKRLKHLALVELDMIDLVEAEDLIKRCRKNDSFPSWEEWTRYNGGDADAAMRLYKRYKKKLESEDLMDLMKTEMKILKTLTRMELFGFQIDKRVHKELCQEYEHKIQEQERRVSRLLGDVNLNSPKQLGKALFKRLGFPIIKRTRAGAPSSDEGVLKELLEQEESPDKIKVLDALLKYRRVDKLYSTYLIGLVNKGLIKYDGRVHCDFKLTGTVTGRLSCKEPNLQNIPREGDIKRMFISSFKNGKILQVDYSQIELRILAHYSNDKKLIQAFKSGRDIHREVAAMVFNRQYDSVTERERKAAKQVDFGIIYMISPDGLARKIGCGHEEAKSYIDGWFEEFTRAREWIRERREEIIETGRSVSLNGRVRRLYGTDPGTPEGREAIRQGVNSPIQGGAGDITKFNMMRLDRRLRKSGMRSRVIANVHDEVLVDCHRKEVRDVIKKINEIFIEPPVPLRVPLGFEIKVGTSWGELKEVSKNA